MKQFTTTAKTSFKSEIEEINAGILEGQKSGYWSFEQSYLDGLNYVNSMKK